MTPREERRFRLVWVVAVLYGVVGGTISSNNDWSVGWIMLAFAVFAALAVWFVHFWPGDRQRR